VAAGARGRAPAEARLADVFAAFADAGDALEEPPGAAPALVPAPPGAPTAGALPPPGWPRPPLGLFPPGAPGPWPAA